MKLPKYRASKRKSLSGSLAVSSCPSPSPAIKEKLALVEEAEERDQESIANPTPMVKAFHKLGTVFITDARDDEQAKISWYQNSSEVSG